MNTPQLFRKTEERTFSAHLMLLHSAEIHLTEAESSELGRFNKCLSAMVLTALAVEALANAVGAKVADDWPKFERLRPHEKLNFLVEQLKLSHEATSEPWTSLQYLGGFRNDVAHGKPEDVVKERVLPQLGLRRTAFDTPLSLLERQITLGNAKRVFAAVQRLKRLFSEALPSEARFGIEIDMWHGSTTPHVA